MILGNISETPNRMKIERDKSFQRGDGNRYNNKNSRTNLVMHRWCIIIIMIMIYSNARKHFCLLLAAKMHFISEIDQFFGTFSSRHENDSN